MNTSTDDLMTGSDNSQEIGSASIKYIYIICNHRPTYTWKYNLTLIN